MLFVGQLELTKIYLFPCQIDISDASWPNWEWVIELSQLRISPLMGWHELNAPHPNVISICPLLLDIYGYTVNAACNCMGCILTGC